MSPSRGLFIYSPVFLFSVAGMALALRQSANLLYKYVSVGVVSVLVLYSKWAHWWGGWAFGPRLLSDIAPLLALLLIPAFQRIERHHLLKGSFYALAGLSVATHGTGAFVPIGWSPDVGERSQRLWSWSEGELANSGCQILFKITGRCYPVDIPRVSVALDDAGDSVGREVPIILRVEAGKNPVAFDGYLQVLDETGRVGFLSSQGVTDEPTPFIVLDQIPGSHHFRLLFSFPRDAISSKYRLQGLLYKAGARFPLDGSQRDRLFERQVVTVPVSR